jgi:hypothetical protein
MLLKNCEWPSLSYNNGFQHQINEPTNVFEMLITPELEYPIVCVSVRKNTNGGLKLDLINTNSGILI